LRIHLQNPQTGQWSYAMKGQAIWMRSSKDLFDIIDATDDQEAVRNLMSETQSISVCEYSRTGGAPHPDSARLLHHELGFRNLLAYLAEQLGLEPQND
jgi:hypothetical protein